MEIGIADTPTQGKAMRKHAGQIALELLRMSRGASSPTEIRDAIRLALEEPAFQNDEHPSMRLVQGPHDLVGTLRAELEILSNAIDEGDPEKQNAFSRVRRALSAINNRCSHLRYYPTLEAADTAWERFVRPGEPDWELRACRWTFGFPKGEWPMPDRSSIQRRDYRRYSECEECGRLFGNERRGYQCPYCGPPAVLRRMRRPRRGVHVDPSKLDDEAGSNAVRDWMADTYDNSLGDYYRRIGHGTRRRDTTGEQQELPIERGADDPADD